MFINETIIVPRYNETDQMGVIYHSNYFVWYEVGRTDFLEKFSMSYRDMEEMGVMLPVIEVNCKYKVSAKYADKLIIKTAIENLTPVRIKFNYIIERETDNVLISEGFTEHVFSSTLNGKPINLKKKYPDLFNLLEKSK
ncbi:acyl-CoA thioesterase [Serpentinicella alkaliphila]|uniref:Acyl-CoA thioester hydrolase n=1 Tax=Serpentinicella alkaliphila TaxID=1734049 RepID=A0A4R2TJG2_9FIRM|nr:thioesterase family protein [Serpentinicella alkaliphila]QUH24699.1 acyl-CoA thioesterase [Serpentinicella alkaliphila]TCQ03688.1 acyl-CoA thioester hydrolase [Serpentinicella alkaliphila]